jgi:hypothetical protein
VAAAGAAVFTSEEDSYSELLSRAAGSLPVLAAPTGSDVDPAGGLATFTTALGPHAPAGSVPQNTPAPPSESGAYALASAGVWAIVLDQSRGALGEPQQCWLAEQLAEAKKAKMPAIVVGNLSVSSASPPNILAPDASLVVPTLVLGIPPSGAACKSSFAETGLTPGSAAAPSGASAYFYDLPEENRILPIASGGASIETYGSGTLGYVNEPDTSEFDGASGFLLTEVEVAKYQPSTGRAPVQVKLMPNISDLAIDATDGVLLRRSHPALFTALARRPRAGMLCRPNFGGCIFVPDPYVPIPDPCQGPNCATGIFPEYSFTSSNPDIGDFVQPDPAEPKGEAVLQGANGKPIPDEHSGLFCAYNPGTTTIGVHTGGLAYSEQVTVQKGSVEQPCGTVPLRNPPAPVQEAGLPVPLPAPAPAPAASPPGTLPPPPSPPPPPPAVKPAPKPHPRPKPPAPPPAFVPALPALALLRPVIVPPPPPAANPAPPTGTSSVQVYQTQVAPQGEREEEQALDVVHNMAAYGPAADSGPRRVLLDSLPLAVILLAFGAARVRRAQDGRSQPRLARAERSGR